MKINLPQRKPRNPLVAPAHLRLAGAHRTGSGAQRQRARHALRRELLQMTHSP